jgi:hypothetical protein
MARYVYIWVFETGPGKPPIPPHDGQVILSPLRQQLPPIPSTQRLEEEGGAFSGASKSAPSIVFLSSAIVDSIPQAENYKNGSANTQCQALFARADAWMLYKIPD